MPPLTDASPPTPPAHDLAARLARLRVPLGFACGPVALWLAQPTAASLIMGGLVAAAGEAIRIWAAGHVEKGREVTTSGPYRWMAHPLYVGSSIMGAGLALAAASVPVAVLVAAYLVTSLTAAIRTEEAALVAAFGNEYRAYRQGRSVESSRRFSLARARRNREHRAIVGLVVGMLLLALRWILRV